MNLRDVTAELNRCTHLPQDMKDRVLALAQVMPMSECGELLDHVYETEEELAQVEEQEALILQEAEQFIERTEHEFRSIDRRAAEGAQTQSDARTADRLFSDL